MFSCQLGHVPITFGPLKNNSTSNSVNTCTPLSFIQQIAYIVIMDLTVFSCAARIVEFRGDATEQQENVMVDVRLDGNNLNV